MFHDVAMFLIGLGLGIFAGHAAGYARAKKIHYYRGLKAGYLKTRELYTNKKDN